MRTKTGTPDKTQRVPEKLFTNKKLYMSYYTQVSDLEFKPFEHTL